MAGQNQSPRRSWRHQGFAKKKNGGQKKKVVKHDRGDVQRIEPHVLIRALRTIHAELQGLTPTQVGDKEPCLTTQVRDRN